MYATRKQDFRNYLASSFYRLHFGSFQDWLKAGMPNGGVQ